MVTAPEARSSSVPVPLVVTVTPEGTLMVVKWCTPGDRTVFEVGENAPSAPLLGNGLLGRKGSSTVPSQLSSIPLHSSVVAGRVTTSDGHAAAEPVQFSAGSQAAIDVDAR